MYRIYLALHVVSIISWMAAILYLYRLYVYHAEETVEIVKERLKSMERKLSKIILLPSSLASILFGLLMLFQQPQLIAERWMLTKLMLVMLLLGMTHFAGRLRRDLEAGRCRFTSKQLRLINEVPTFLMIGIIFLVILKPF